MKPSLLLLMGCLLTAASVAPAQNRPEAESAPRHERGLYALCTHIDPNGWLFLRHDAGLSFSDLFARHGSQLGLSAYDEMRERQRYQDAQGRLHVRYQQWHRGLPVEGAWYTLHGPPGKLEVAHGHLAHSLDLLPQPGLSPEQARQRLLTQWQDHRLAHQDPTWEAALRHETGDSSATWLPQPQLVIMAQPDGDRMRYRLAYRCEVRSLQPDRWVAVWLDAHDGSELRRRSLRHACQNVTGTADLHFYGTRSLTLRDRQFPHYDYSLEACGAQQIHTKPYRLNSFGEQRAWAWTSHLNHSRTHWGSHAARATTAHWAAQQAWQYFAEQHDWHGPDDAGSELRIFVDWQPPAGAPENLAWYQLEKGHHYLYLGRQGELPMATLDLVGHEMAHAVIRTAAQLGYERETGALHEGLADIMGTLVEAHVLGETHDWVVAQEIGGLRSLADPQAFAQPSYYQEDPLWVPTAPSDCPTPSHEPLPLGNDNCGIHTNSGVVNRWWYLLAHGGEQAGVRVSGIGLAEAGQLVFHLIRSYLDEASDFTDARLGSIQAATDLFGACSNQLAQVRNAWGAVGVGRPNEILCVQIDGPPQYCLDQTGETHTYQAKAAAGATFIWGPLPPGVQHRIVGEQQQFLVIEALADSVESFTLSVQAHLDSQQANQTLALQTAFCQNFSSRTGQPLPLDADTWRVYPNPTRGNLEVFIQEGHFPGEVSICDPLGRVILRRRVSRSNFTLDLSALSSGCYLARLDGPDGRHTQLVWLQP